MHIQQPEFIEPVKKVKVSEFEYKVYTVVKSIPPGMVSSYSAVAKAIGNVSPRAVGQALKKNPFAPYVPCHRVINNDLTLGGFKGRTKGKYLLLKKRLLEKEGVKFKKGKVASPSIFFYPPPFIKLIKRDS